MWFYLGGIGVPREAQGGNEGLGVGLPIDIGVGRQVGVVVTNGSIQPDKDVLEHLNDPINVIKESYRQNDQNRKNHIR